MVAHARFTSFIASMWLVTAAHAAGDPKAVSALTEVRTATAKQTLDRAHSAVPSAVQNFLKRAELCEHFGGEFNGDRSERDREVNRELERYKCDQIPSELRTLKAKYKNNAVVAEQLKNFECALPH